MKIVAHAVAICETSNRLVRRLPRRPRWRTTRASNAECNDWEDRARKEAREKPQRELTKRQRSAEVAMCQNECDQTSENFAAYMQRWAREMRRTAKRAAIEYANRRRQSPSNSRSQDKKKGRGLRERTPTFA